MDNKQAGFHPVVTTEGERFVYDHVVVSYANALLASMLIKLMHDMQWAYAREVWRDVFRGSFERVGNRSMARAMQPIRQCQVLTFARKP